LWDRLIVAGYWFVYIALELSILFLGISFLIGVLTTYVSPQKVERILSKYGKGLIGNMLGTLFGGILPFCSCSTIPALIGLLKVGIPFRIAMSFLIASPLGVLNAAVFSLFYVMFGAKVAISYIAVTFIGAVIAGFVLDRLGLKVQLKRVSVVGGHEEEPPAAPPRATLLGRVKPKLVSSWGFTKDLYLRMVPYLLIGVGIGAFIYGFVPDDLLATYAGPSNIFAVPIAAALGVPMYVRTETMIPLCYALFEKGMGLGTMMALIIGGAGISIPEMTLLSAIFKRKLLTAYILTVFIIATLTGYLFNAFGPLLMA